MPGQPPGGNLVRMKPNVPTGSARSESTPYAALAPALLIVLLWGLAVLIVRPWGGFMINDDWSYVRSLEALRDQGQLISTGWHGGGLALISHLLWGGLFAWLFGFSMNTLRMAVAVMGLLGVLAVYYLPAAVTRRRWVSLFAALTVMLNPLYLSQSFTYMTDITFAGLVALSLSAVGMGLEKRSPGRVALGMLPALAATLTRQYGLLIPVGVVGVCLLHSEGRSLGRIRMIAPALIPVAGWLIWEMFLSAAGSTPVTEHQLFEKLLGNFQSLGPGGYALYLLQQFFLNGLLYVAVLVSPVLALQSGPCLRPRAVRLGLLVYFGLVAVLAALLYAGLPHPPVAFHYNVIIDFGIGPLLFKDTYILGIRRLDGLPPHIWCLLVGWAGGASVPLLARIIGALRRLVAGGRIRPAAAAALLGALAYWGIITVTGFHDRYLIPVCLLVVVWLVMDPPEGTPNRGGRAPAALAAACLALIAAFSLAGTHDFMATRRAAHQAHEVLLRDMGVDSCRVDGGFEFNGYHCHDPDFKPVPGLSWWWVRQENYLVALGPLPGYEVVRSFPIKRYLGADGRVCLLRPLPGAGRP